MKKIRLVWLILILIAIVAASVSLALFTDRKADSVSIKVGEIQVDLKEDWPDDVSEIGIEKYTKKVHGESVKEKKAYVRMRFIPVIEYLYTESTNEGQEVVSEWRTAPVSQDNIRITVSNDEDWVRQGDYYYYKEILEQGERTSDLDLKWDIYEIPSALASYENIRTDVKVLLEYSQVSNEAWKKIFKIDELPEGVERQGVE